MPIKFPCPHCKQSLSIRDELAGKSGRCPRCQQTITVPAAGTTAPAAPAPAKAPSAAPPPASAKAPPPRPPGGQAGGNARTVPGKKVVPPPVPPPLPQKSAPTASTPLSADTTAPSPVANAPGSPSPVADTSASPEDIEAEAAALFSDKPAEETKAPTTVDFNCPFCDTALHLPAELAGKKSPCPNPECRRIIKVPELVKGDPRDWRKATIGGPSMAKVDTGPAPEGAWGSTEARLASGQALVEAGVIQKRQKPRTLLQKLIRPVLYGTVVLVLGGGGLGWYSWWAHNREARALKAAEDWAASEACRQKAGVAGQAALCTGIGEYYRRTGEPSCGKKAYDRYGKALNALGQGAADSERDAALVELALAVLELGGTGDDVLNELRISWDETQKMLRAILSLMGSEGRLETLRVVSRTLLAKGQADRVLPLAGQVFPSPEANKAEAAAAVGLVFLAAGDDDRAGKAADQVLSLFDAKSPPPVRPSVVALALALKKPAPKAGKPENERADHFVGTVEGLARQEKWEQARTEAKKDQFDAPIHFRALVGVAAAAVDAKSPDAARDVNAALDFLNDKVRDRDRSELSWTLRRLMDLGQRAGIAEDRLRELASAIADPALRGRAQLIVFRTRLAHSKDAAEEGAAEQAVARSVGQFLAFQALARHNTRRDPDWAKGVGGWEEPRQAFGWLGVVLGLQDRKKGE
jgi:hypothetical protein